MNYQSMRQRILDRKSIEEMKENPLLYPKEQNIPLPSDDYRSALFYGRYKIIYKIEKETIYIDAIFDCRQDNRL